MDRRAFLGTAVSTLAAAVAAAQAQQTRVRLIGWLTAGEPPTAERIQSVWSPARALGWFEGQNLVVEYRAARGKVELLRPFAEDLVRLNADVIVTLGTQATLAAMQATRSLPIVFYSAGDPVGAGLVESLARPGGNVTGFSQIAAGVDEKRLTLLREVLPNARRVGDLMNRANPFFRLRLDSYRQTYHSLGLQPIFVEVGEAGELEGAIAAVADQGGQALVVRDDGLFSENRVVIMSAALQHRLPTFAAGSLYMEAGALLGYRADEKDGDRRFTVMIDKILRGAKPADLPVEQSTKFTLVVNLKAARALGLTIPQSVLLRADEVIQ